MTIRAVCFDFQDTLAYMEPAHLRLYVQAAAEHDISVSEQSFAEAIDDAWDRWRTPLGIDHSQASTDERSFHAVRTGVHRHRVRAAGIDGRLIDPIAERIAEVESDPRHYRLFDDAVPALERLAQAGVEAIIVSNHVWQLPEIVAALGIALRPDAVLTSARVGYRKPHPEIYAAALRRAGCNPSEVLFVGDNPQADVEGPRAAGMQALLLDRGSTEDREDVIHVLTDLPL